MGYYELMIYVGNGDVAAFFSYLLISIVIYFNFATITDYLYAFTSLKINIIPSSNLESVLLMFAIMGVVHLLIKNSKIII